MKKLFPLLIALLTLLPQAAVADILRPDSVTIKGRIVGYEPDSIVNALTIGTEDILFSNSGKRVIPINADGTFSRTFRLTNAQTVSAKIYPNSLFFPYLEPGETLEIEIDNNALPRNAFPFRNIEKEIRYGGSLGQLNIELAGAPDFDQIIALDADVDERVSPQQFKDSVIRNFDRQNLAIERYVATLPANSKAPAILRGYALADAVGSLLQYSLFNHTHKALPLEYYRDFIGALLHCDSTILVDQNAHSLLSDLANSPLLPSNRFDVSLAELQQAIDLIQSNGGKFTPEELKQIYLSIDTIGGEQVQHISRLEAPFFIDALTKAAKRAGVYDEYLQRRGPSLDFEHRMLAEVHDSLITRNPAFLREFFGLEKLPVIWEYSVAANRFEEIMGGDTLRLDSFGITDPTLRARLEADHAALMSNSPVAENDSPAMAYFRQLVEPFRGKYLYIDFWEMYCPPCRAEIQTSVDFREQYKDSPDFALMFICSENGTPPDGFEKYTRDYLTANTSLRLSRVQIDLLAELLNFDSVPFGVIVDPAGNILRTNSALFEFKLFLQRHSLLEQPH